MPTPVPDILLQRIDTLTGQLNPAVSRAGGAAFALTLSMIHQAQQLTAGAATVDVTAPAGDARQQLYTVDVVGRLGRAVAAGQRGELAMLVSWLDSAPLPRSLPLQAAAPSGSSVPLAQAAVLSKSYTLLDEISESALSVAA